MPCDTPIIVENVKDFEKIPVPCGNCPPCKKRRVDAWVFRLMQEDKVSDAAHFVTLTYDTRSIPLTKNGFMTLYKKDFQNFMKRLRKLHGRNKKSIRYYAVGEYGTHNERPHYHAIIFNVKDAESYTRAWSLTENGYETRAANMVEDGNVYGGRFDHYGEGRILLGSIDVGQVGQNSVAYVAKYMDKKAIIPKHDRDDRKKEFSLMSKGLGKNYLTPEIIRFHKRHLDKLYITKPGGIKIAMPKYYRDKIFDQTEKDAQLDIIAAAMEEKISEERARIEGRGINYGHWLANSKKGRIRRFERFNSKNRNL